MEAPWRIERLTADHDRSDFFCGKPPLDEFLQRFATQYDRRDCARTYVAVLPPAPAVLGYFTLSGGALDLRMLPEVVRNKLPRHPAPVACLGRLAVPRAAQGQQLGKALLLDALRRCSQSSLQIALYAVEVEAIDEEAKGFYLKYGFTPLADDPLHLYLSMKTVRALGL